MINKDKILVGIHRAIHDKVDPELEVYRKILKYNDIPYIDLDSSDLDFWEKVQKVTHFIYKWSHAHGDHQIANAIIPIIQYHLGKKCFPSWETSWIYDDKIKETYLLQVYNFPIAKSYIFYHKSKALDFIKNAPYPLVFKLKNGAGSFNVQLVKNKYQARRLVKKMFGNGLTQNQVSIYNITKTFNFDFYKIFRYFGIQFRDSFLQKYRKKLWLKHKNYIYFQEFMPGNDYDTRVQITGNRAFAFVRYNRPNDFRASGSNNWSLDHSKIDMEFVRIAFDISRKLKFQSMAYDFIYDKTGKPVIVEISYCYGDYPEFSTGFWDENLIWHPGRFLPQYLELIDLLELSDLKQPDILPGSSYIKVSHSK